MVKASGSPHVFRLCLGVNKGMFPVRDIHSNKASSLCPSNFMEVVDCHEVEAAGATPSLGVITGFKAVVAVCL